MIVPLEGGCFVADSRHGDPFRSGNLRVWHPIGLHSGTRAISLRVIELAPGPPRGLSGAGEGRFEEAVFVLSGRGTAWVDGFSFDLEPNTGLFVGPGASLAARCEGTRPLLLIGARCPDPGPTSGSGDPVLEPAVGSMPPDPVPVVRLGDVERRRTADRWYSEMVDPRIGSRHITQFVGSIPPGRAPDHFHRYEEALFILEGRGVMWAGETRAPITPGACVFLPFGQRHCVENTGEGELRLLGVFYPAGSPAVRYASPASTTSS